MSKFEAGVRKVIGGGEMRTWDTDSNMYRGGGCFSDAILLLADASTAEPGKTLSQSLEIEKARSLLQLPSGLPVPDGPDVVVIKSFNNEATAGPFFRAFGVKRKFGMKPHLESFAWTCYENFVRAGGKASYLPFVTARVGFRTKLLSNSDALKKMSLNKPLGRCVMMLDAIEQPFSAPLYNVLSAITAHQRFDRESGFRNTIIRASSDWMKFWDEVKAAMVIVELDWKKFDRERPAADLRFMIEVICSCFTPKSRREELLLSGYRIMLERALVERCFVCDDGGVFSIDGMVPSGSLWTGWLDTALNILYLNAALISLGVPSFNFSPKCAGDDNITLFYRDYPESVFDRLRNRLNAWFRAGIEKEDFIVHRPPFYVTKAQACFPPGTDLSKGTSKLLDSASWVPFRGNLVIDQPAGRSHRWKYIFEGKPKFLSCYWLRDGRPIRPTHINAEKLLFPEGIHQSIEQYQAAVLSMVVDNPWNQHNVNHMMHRFVICGQVRRLAVSGIKAEDILWYSRIKASDIEEVPFPNVACWRRSDGWVDIEGLHEFRASVGAFREFVAGVTSLYARAASGGIDAYKYMEFIRGEADLGEGQFGNDIDVWLSWIYNNPLSKYLKPTKSFRRRGEKVVVDEQTSAKIRACLAELTDLLGTTSMYSIESFCFFLSDRLYGMSKDQ
jgi:hypothetical protein